MTTSKAINEKKFSPAVQQRYDDLTAKLLAEDTTPAEHKELLDLIDRAEKMDAERLGVLIELSQMSGVSINELIDPPTLPS